MTSHETACILNASDQDAEVRITFFFSVGCPVSGKIDPPVGLEPTRIRSAPVDIAWLEEPVGSNDLMSGLRDPAGRRGHAPDRRRPGTGLALKERDAEEYRVC